MVYCNGIDIFGYSIECLLLRWHMVQVGLSGHSCFLGSLIALTVEDLVRDHMAWVHLENFTFLHAKSMPHFILSTLASIVIPLPFHGLAHSVELGLQCR